MHELPFTKSIYNAVMKKASEVGAKRVVMVALEVGVLRDYIPEIVQKYWDYIAKGDIAEGSTIEIETIPATVSCRVCGTIYEVDVSDIANANCPECGCPTGKLVTGRELRIVGIEIE